jgi:hypothetical protein
MWARLFLPALLLQLIAPSDALPTEYRSHYTHYATITRPDAVRKLYIAPTALQAIRRGQGLTDDAEIVMEVYKAGRLQPVVSVSRKQAGSWRFSEVSPARPHASQTQDVACQTCHGAAYAQEFMFTLPQLLAFAKTDEVQQVSCNRLGRRPCSP